MESQGIFVGDILEEGRPYPKPLSAQFVWRSYCCWLVLYVPDVTPTEHVAVLHGPCQLGAFAQDGILVLLARFRGLVFEAPWSLWREPQEYLPLLDEALPPGYGLGLHIALVDGTNGVIRAFRRVGLGHALSEALREAACAQRDQPRDHADVNRAVRALEAAHANFWPLAQEVYTVGTREETSRG